MSSEYQSGVAGALRASLTTVGAQLHKADWRTSLHLRRATIKEAIATATRVPLDENAGRQRDLALRVVGKEAGQVPQGWDSITAVRSPEDTLGPWQRNTQRGFRRPGGHRPGSGGEPEASVAKPRHRPRSGDRLMARPSLRLASVLVAASPRGPPLGRGGRACCRLSPRLRARAARRCGNARGGGARRRLRASKLAPQSIQARGAASRSSDLVQGQDHRGPRGHYDRHASGVGAGRRPDDIRALTPGVRRVCRAGAS